jgi:glycosyltransferase involved in cell wall biosynthesis
VSRARLVVLPEIGEGDRPHSSPFVRLIRPLGHPVARSALDTRFALDYLGEPVDGVIVDRLWGPWGRPAAVEALIGRVRDAGARLIYSLDDNLLDRRADGGEWPTDAQLAVIERLATEADGMLVSTPQLAERMAVYNPRVIVVPNALDERLVVGGRLPALPPAFDEPEPVVVGWMGTLTHDEDLIAIAPAIREVARRHGERVRFECVGVVRHDESRRLLDGVPVLYHPQRLPETEYPQFMLWFTRHVRWDVGIAALADTPFTRGKSDLKYLDYAAIGAAGAYSRVPAYAATVRDGVTGLLADNTAEAWTAALDRLVADAPLRRRLADAAQRELYAGRTLERRAGDWVAAIRSILDAAPEAPSTPMPALQEAHR